MLSNVACLCIVQTILIGTVRVTTKGHGSVQRSTSISWTLEIGQSAPSASKLNILIL
jgi:hypothetical protein